MRSISLRVIWECWVRLLQQTLFLSWLWVLECDRAPLITCRCTGQRIQNLSALRWSQSISEGSSTWSPLTLRGGTACYTRAGCVSGSTRSCLSFILAAGAPRWTLSMELGCQAKVWEQQFVVYHRLVLPGFWWAELLADALLLFDMFPRMFYLTARLLNLYLRFHRASPRMDEEYGDRKYHYFFSLFFLTTALLHV